MPKLVIWVLTIVPQKWVHSPPCSPEQREEDIHVSSQAEAPYTRDSFTLDILSIPLLTWAERTLQVQVLATFLAKNIATRRESIPRGQGNNAM